MAEATGATGTSARFYCHVCNEDITPALPEYTCPGCQGGFIEQRDVEETIADDPDDELPPMDDQAMRAVTQMLNFVPLSFNHRPLVLGGRGNVRAPPGGAVPGGPQPQQLPQQQPMQLPQAGGFLGDLLDSLFANFPNVRVNVDTGGQGPIHFRLHGNPGDYAWGNAELDRIVTQLLNQLDSSGPPPLGQTLIQRLPTVTISQASVDANLQCMVCFEDYKLDEKVRELPCSHLYHSICIVPWLELHGTCPVCRSSVDPATASQKTAPAGRPPEPGPSSRPDGQP